jgi:NAD(P)-dependent dehydrogenase (short-subunit alcohol dehydrogenase family)
VFFNRYHIFKKLCTSGIGLESSLLFAQEGANVLLVDVNLAAVEKAASLIKERVPNAKTAVIKADVSKEADVKAAVDLAVKEFGRLDVMVCGRVFFGQLHYYTHASYWL